MSSASQTPRLLLPDWAEFERDYVVGGVPHTYVVRPAPFVGLFVESGATKLGARFATESDAVPTPITAEIDVALRIIEGRRMIEVSTSSRPLFANFFGLVAEVVSAVICEGRQERIALAEAVARWQSLLSRKPLMSIETQAGLFGELWCLEQLAQRAPAEALDAWIGPTQQAHDFRFGNIELEVKTTGGTRRIHLINGATQLEPSTGCTLFLLSLQLAAAGAGGSTLGETVARSEQLMATVAGARERLNSLLERVGWSSADAQLYPTRWRLRTEPRLIEVAPGVPRITRNSLATLAADFPSERLGHIVYAIDVEGLGRVCTGAQLEDMFVVTLPKD